MQFSFISNSLHRVARSLERRQPKPATLTSHFTSGLQSYFICDHCFRKFHLKRSLILHLISCASSRSVMCDICQIKFTNKGNLALHSQMVHKDSKYNQHGPTFLCVVCGKGFRDNWKLMCHVRKTYFNLSRETHTHTTKNINEVWVERVFNSSLLVEMRKVNKNLILIRKCDSSKDHLIEEPEKMYRSDISALCHRANANAERIACTFCNKWMLKRSMTKHINERHWNTKLHKCKSCDYRCKRPYQLLRHVCGEVRRRGPKRKKINVPVPRAVF